MMINSNPDCYLKFEDQRTADAIAEKVAKSKVGETAEIVETSLTKLREKLTGAEDIICPFSEDSFLLKFLRVSKFDVTSAYERIRKYYRVRKKYPEIFANLYPSSTRKAQDLKAHYALPLRTLDNSVILVNKRGLFDHKLVTFEEYLRLDLLSLEVLVENPLTQLCGVTAIIDMKGLSFWVVPTHTPRRLYMFFDILQNSFPLRFVAIHVVNAPDVFGFIYNMSVPFLTKKLKNRIFIHRSDQWHSLHSHLAPEMLPKEYGGLLEDSEMVNIVEIINSKEQEFRKQLLYGLKSD